MYKLTRKHGKAIQEEVVRLMNEGYNNYLSYHEAPKKILVVRDYMQKPSAKFVTLMENIIEKVNWISLNQ